MSPRHWTSATLLLLLVAFVVSDVAAVDHQHIQQNVVEQLALLRQQLAAAQAEFRSLLAEEEQVQGRLAEATKRIELAQREQELQQQRVEEMRQALREANAHAEEAAQELSDMQRSFRGRLVTSYKMRKKAGALDYLLNSSSSPELLKRSKYLSAIAAADTEGLSRAQRAQRTLEWRRELALRHEQDEQLALQKVGEIAAELERQRDGERELLERLQRSQEEKKGVVARHETALERFEQVLAGLTGKEDGQRKPRRLVGHRNGIGTFRDTLVVPVQGQVVRHFGEEWREGVGRMLPSNGIEISTGSSAVVRAVAPGRIALVDELPGLGQVIIVDHGSREYSLYGGVVDVRRVVNDTVEQGSELARVAGRNDGAALYFEVRRAGAAQPPLAYFPSGAFGAPHKSDGVTRIRSE